MGYTRDVRYWKRISTYEYEPFACTKKEMFALIDPDKERWCPDCQAVVEFEGGLDKLGLYIKCPFCGGKFFD